MFRWLGAGASARPKIETVYSVGVDNDANTVSAGIVSCPIKRRLPALCYVWILFLVVCFIATFRRLGLGRVVILRAKMRVVASGCACDWGFAEICGAHIPSMPKIDGHPHVSQPSRLEASSIPLLNPVEGEAAM